MIALAAAGWLPSQMGRASYYNYSSWQSFGCPRTAINRSITRTRADHALALMRRRPAADRRLRRTTASAASHPRLGSDNQDGNPVSPDQRDWRCIRWVERLLEPKLFALELKPWTRSSCSLPRPPSAATDIWRQPTGPPENSAA